MADTTVIDADAERDRDDRAGRRMLDVADRLIGAATAHGAQEAEAYVSSQRTRSARAVQDRIDWVRDTDVNGVGLRVVRDGSIGYVYCSMSGGAPLSDPAVLAAEALDLARITEPTGAPFPMLPTEGGAVADVPGLSHPEAISWDIEEIATAVGELAAAALAVPGVVDVPRNHYGIERAHVAVANSHGVRAAYGSTLRYLWAETLASSGGRTATGNDAAWDRGTSGLDARAIGTRAGESAGLHLDSLPAPSGDVPVVLTPQAAVNLVSRLGMMLTADAVGQGRSLFRRLGDRVAAPAFTLIDDATIPGGLNSRPVDAEGVATGRTTLIDRGTFAGVLHDSATAAAYPPLDGSAHASGNAIRSSYRAMPRPGASNLYLAPSTEPAASLIAQVGQGLLVEELIGLHATNPVTGRFGAAVRGRLIRQGRLGRPISDTAVSGRYLDVLAGVLAVADDLTFLPGSSGLGSPSVLIERMSVTGVSGGSR